MTQAFRCEVCTDQLAERREGRAGQPSDRSKALRRNWVTQSLKSISRARTNVGSFQKELHRSALNLAVMVGLMG